MKKRDGLGFEDRPVVDHGANGAELMFIDNGVAEDVERNELEGLGAPVKNHGVGRLTTSRDKAPYEGTCGFSKRTRFCTIYRCSGHKRTTCLSMAMCQNSQGRWASARIVALLVTGETPV
jgi:hypothetical protein